MNIDYPTCVTSNCGQIAVADVYETDGVQRLRCGECMTDAQRDDRYNDHEWVYFHDEALVDPDEIFALAMDDLQVASDAMASEAWS